LDVEMKIENISKITPAKQDFSIQNKIEGNLNKHLTVSNNNNSHN
jgi:hypothetical protein